MIIVCPRPEAGFVFGLEQTKIMQGSNLENCILDYRNSVNVFLKFKVLFLYLILTVSLLGLVCWAAGNLITCIIKQ